MWVAGWRCEVVINIRSFVNPSTCSFGRLFMGANQGAGSFDSDLGLIDVVVAVKDSNDTEGLEQSGGYGPATRCALVLTRYLGGTNNDNEQ